MIHILLYAFILLQSGFCRTYDNQLPKPSGKYLTGVSYLALTDSSRKELFDNDLKNYREMTMKVWYPADKAAISELYLEKPGELITNFGFAEIYKTLKTNSSRDIPVSSVMKAYPVLIFSHGWGEHFSQNTILMEELASHGYIVFSLAHHFESKFSVYPDGRLIIMNPASDRFKEFIKEQGNPEAIAIFEKMLKAANDTDRAAIFNETNRLMPKLMTGSPAYWADDIIFLINELERINDSHGLFEGKLDLNRIGILGMSMGGIATNEVCIRDSRVKAGVNIDGALYGSAISHPVRVPFLFINSERYLGYGNLFTSRVNNYSYSVTVKNSSHYNFTDYALYPVQNLSQIGKIDPQIPIFLMNRLIVLFFDKYIRNSDNASLQSVCNKYDVEYVSGAH